MLKPVNATHPVKTKMLIGGTILMLAATSALSEENASHDYSDLDARRVLPDETKYYGVGRLGLRFAF